MISLIYTVENGKKTEEMAWLSSMKVYPSVRLYYDWSKHPPESCTQFCVIVAPDAALAIKLRHPVQFQENYFQR